MIFLLMTLCLNKNWFGAILRKKIVSGAWWNCLKSCLVYRIHKGKNCDCFHISQYYLTETDPDFYQAKNCPLGNIQQFFFQKSFTAVTTTTILVLIASTLDVYFYDSMCLSLDKLKVQTPTQAIFEIIKGQVRKT